MGKLSLIYPEQPSQDFIIDGNAVKCLMYGYLFGNSKVDLNAYLCCDEETISYRQEVFRDLLSIPELCEILFNIRQYIINIDALKESYSLNTATEEKIYMIKQIELYIEFIVSSYNALLVHASSISSRGLKRLFDNLRATRESQEFIKLENNTSKLSHTIKHIKSVVFAANLNPDLSLSECGVLSFEDDYYKSSNIIDRLLRAELEQKNTVMTPFTVVSKTFTKDELYNATLALNNSLSKVLKKSISSWEPEIKRFSINSIENFLFLPKEIDFLLCGVEIQRSLQDVGAPLVMPICMPIKSKVCCLVGLYNPLLALSGKKIVKNDVSINEQNGIFLLYGPNNGGKSILLSAVGIAQLFFQLGFLIPADKAEMSPASHIFVNYTDKTANVNNGRLVDECRKMSEIFDKLDEFSLVLMDETFSSTISYEGGAIACDVLAGMAAFGCRAVFTTHIIEIAHSVEAINAYPSTKTNISILTSCVDDDRKNTYRFSPGFPTGTSYAQSISNEYGLSYQTLLEKSKPRTT